MASKSTTKTTTTEEEWVDVEATMEEKAAPKEKTETSEKESTNQPPSELDLVFIVDNTGSMGPWIRSAQDNVQKIVQDIKKEEATDVRFALVSYRDHPPQDHSYVTQTHDFTTDMSEMQKWVNAMKADGGGDGPEAVADALHDALCLSYRPNSTKVAVLIADAPPHGLGCVGDGFPNGCPLGHDPLKITRSMAEKGITIYTVICGNFEGQAFYQGVAQITGGQYVPIASAHLLAGVIVGGAQEEISLERLMQEAQATVRREEEAAGRQLDDDEMTERLRGVFIEKGSAVTRTTQFGRSDLPDYETSADVYYKASTLADVRKNSTRDHLAIGAYGAGIDSAPAMRCASFSTSAASAPTVAQCKRMVFKSRARVSKKKEDGSS